MYLKSHKIKQYIDILNLVVMDGENKFGDDTVHCLQLFVCFAFLKKEDFLCYFATKMHEVRDFLCLETYLLAPLC